MHCLLHHALVPVKFRLLGGEGLQLSLVPLQLLEWNPRSAYQTFMDSSPDHGAFSELASILKLACWFSVLSSLAWLSNCTAE